MSANSHQDRVGQAAAGSPGRRPGEIPLRNQLALSIALLVGYFLGLLEALDWLPYGPTLTFAAVGLGIALVVGLAGVVRGSGRLVERVFVSLLRAGLSGGVFVFVFEGMRLLLKIGDLGGAVASWIGAGILALVLARLAPAGANRSVRPPASGSLGAPSGRTPSQPRPA